MPPTSSPFSNLEKPFLLTIFFVVSEILPGKKASKPYSILFLFHNHAKTFSFYVPRGRNIFHSTYLKGT